MNSKEILEKLISFQTVSSQSNAALIAWVTAFLRDQGCTVDVIDGADGKQALWARLGPAVPGGFALAGHSDVVPTEGQVWATDPFKMTELSGNLYGRGSCDMKGFLASALALACSLKGKTLAKPLYIGLTYDEETSMIGARKLSDWLIANGIKPSWVWLGEPTGMEVVTAHKGASSYTTTFTGVAAHSSLPAKGVNAIALASKLCAWVLQMAESCSVAPVKGSAFDPPYTTFNLGVIKGGKASNIIADKCSIQWEYRLHPGDHAECINKAYAQFLEQTLQDVQARFSAVTAETEVEIDIPPFVPSPNNAGEKLLCAKTGSGKALSVSYATEAGYFQKAGADVVICGPGSITKAHQPNEYVPIADLEKCDALLRQCAAEQLF